MKTYYKTIDSPIGLLYIVANTEQLIGLTPYDGWEELRTRFKNLTEEDNNILIETQRQLEEYFRGNLKKFDLPIRFDGTEFQKSAWRALLDIPYGTTISYSEQARNIGNPKAIRAVGGANGANPISIIIPCHRVIGKSGKLTGYASGIDKKNIFLIWKIPINSVYFSLF